MDARHHILWSADHTLDDPANGPWRAMVTDTGNLEVE